MSTERLKNKSNHFRLQIYERDPLNEPSMQLESLVEIDELAQIGGDINSAQDVSGFMQFSRPPRESAKEAFSKSALLLHRQNESSKPMQVLKLCVQKLIP